MKSLILFLSNLLNIRQGERRRLAIFYVMLFLFSNGVNWGGSVVEAAFINQPGLGVPALPLIIMADAVVSVIAIIIYTAFVDRIANDYLLIGLLFGFVIGIAAGHALITVGQFSIAYSLLFVVNRASDSIFLLHWWTYVSEYYDIRAFKRLAPVILSAKTLGLLTSGLTLPLLTSLLRPADIILIWLCTQALIIVPTRLMPRLLRETRRPNIHHSLHRESFITSMREGYRYVRFSGYLRWFALASLALAIASALFQSLSSQVVQATFPDETGYANFLGVMSIIGGFLSFPLQLFLMNRIIRRIGVGGAMQLYPLSTAIASAALVFLPPQVFSAALGVLNRSPFRLAFRAPIMGLVYNVVPARVRGRTRAFVSGLVEPVGAVLGSMTLLAIHSTGQPGLLAGTLMLLVAVYILATIATQRRYSSTLVETLQNEEYSALAGSDVLSVSDPQTLNQLKARLLAASPHTSDTFFLARLLAESGGKAAVPILKDVLAAHPGDTTLQLAVINALVMTQATTPDVITLYLQFIDHPDEQIRQAAIDGLDDAAEFTPSQYQLLHTRLQEETNIELRARLIPVVLRSGDAQYIETAHAALSTLLNGGDNSEVLLGLEVITDIDDTRYLPRMITLAEHYDDELRLGAVRALDAFARRNIPTGLSIQHFDHLLHDPVEHIRELALSILRYTDDPEQHDLMLVGLKDPSTTVRRAAVRVLVEMGHEIIPLLVTASEAKRNDPLGCKMATVALAHLQRQRYQRAIEDYIVADLREIYQNHRQLGALEAYQASQGIRILRTTLQEQNEEYLDDIFYLLSAIAPAASIATIREALESDSPTIKAGGVEALESIVSAQTANWIASRFDDRLLHSFMASMMEQTGIPARLRPEAALRQLIMDQDDSWLRATAAFALGEIEGLFSEADRDTLFKKALTDSYADVRQAVRAATRRRSQSQEQLMLSQIERIMFLKQVSIFQSIPLEQLKAIAMVCEPESFPAKAIIFRQGEASSGLYVITAGQVAIQVHGQRTETIQLATLGVNAYFGDMSLFNNRPRSAAAVALQPTEVLKLSRTSFIRLVRQFPDMSLTLLDVLSQRLAEVNEQLADNRSTTV